ncbi:MAG: aminotransferase class V-fold PLP-dependent enzyme [Actinomycetota bacterium]
MAVYLDCAATSPLDPRVGEEVLRFLQDEFGNAGSRTHEYGVRARRGVEQARDAVAAALGAARGDVIFTSGATESNNLALFGLEAHGRRTGRMHLISTQIEHHAVLEPLAELRRRGFQVTLLPPTPGGWVDAEEVRAALRPETLLVSVMHVNNETGVAQPLREIAEVLEGHPAYLHSDAAQGFGKDISTLRNPRIDLISVSGHKLCAPKGIGALLTRRRNGERPPLAPLMLGGGQERGIRPGTLPTPLIVGLGKAAEFASAESAERTEKATAFRQRLLEGLAPLRPELNGDLERALPYTVNLSIPGYTAETVMEAWERLVAISDGAACTSQSATCSHVLSAMGLRGARIEGAVRLSWCHLSELPDVEAMVQALRQCDSRLLD